MREYVASALLAVLLWGMTGSSEGLPFHSNTGGLLPGEDGGDMGGDLAGDKKVIKPGTGWHESPYQPVYKPAHFNYRTVGGEILQYKDNLSVFKCIRLCFTDPRCEIFNFNRKTGICELVRYPTALIEDKDTDVFINSSYGPSPFY